VDGTDGFGGGGGGGRGNGANLPGVSNAGRGGSGGDGTVVIRHPATYTVTFDNGDGSTTTGSYTTGGSVELPPAPTSDGRTFLGWFDAPSGGNKLSSPYFPPSFGDITIHARWSGEGLTDTGFRSTTPLTLALALLGLGTLLIGSGRRRTNLIRQT
jgi:hypothetical protein